MILLDIWFIEEFNSYHLNQQRSHKLCKIIPLSGDHTYILIDLEEIFDKSCSIKIQLNEYLLSTCMQVVEEESWISNLLYIHIHAHTQWFAIFY